MRGSIAAALAHLNLQNRPAATCIPGNADIGSLGYGFVVVGSLARSLAFAAYVHSGCADFVVSTDRRRQKAWACSRSVHSLGWLVSLDLKSRSMDQIVLSSPDFPDGRITLSPSELPVVMGRSRRCQITIDDGLLSRRHSEIRLNRSGKAELHDLESTNLTIVNERDVASHELKSGDVILLGETEIRVELIPMDDDPHEKTTRDLTLLPGPEDETAEDR